MRFCAIGLELSLFQLQLGGNLTLSFVNETNKHNHLLLNNNEAVVLSGASRYGWLYSVAFRKYDKNQQNELLFRQRCVLLQFLIKRDNSIPCSCAYPQFCNSQSYYQITEKEKQLQVHQEPGQRLDEIKIKNELEEAKCNIDNLKASNFEQKYVYDVYEKIAPHFSHTRYKPWPKIESFLNQLPLGSLVADVGCGNGKYLNTNQDNILTIGTDRSQNLLTIAREKFENCQVFSADSLKLPWRAEVFDYVISIAVVHHFSNDALRIAAIKELLRILKVNGIVLIYVWAFEQKERNFTEQDIFVPWNLSFKYENEKVIQNLQDQVQEEQKTTNDQFLNESKQTVVYKRYYHVFKKGELEELLKQIPNIEIVESYYDHANWCCTFQKLK